MSLSCVIVDDSEAFLVSATKLLSLQGIRVIGQASTGSEALRLAEALCPDVVLVDVELGDEDGIEVARRITSRVVSTKVILISLRERSDLGRLITDVGVAGFVRKVSLSAPSIAALIDPRTPGAGAESSPISTRSPGDSEHLLREERALRRVATLVAQGEGSDAVFSAVAVEATLVLGVGAVSILSYDAGHDTFTKIFGTQGDRSAIPDGTTWPAAKFPAPNLVLRTGLPARFDDWAAFPWPIASRHLALEFGPAVAAPIVVNNEIWGVLAAYGEVEEVLPAECELQLADYTNLVAAAISNAQAREEVRALEESQAALRRVATLLAEGAEPKALFAAVAVEASRIIGVGAVSLIRYDPETDMLTKLFGTHGDRSPVPDGATWPVQECPEGVLVLETGGPARVDDWTSLLGPMPARHVAQGFGQAIAAPIVVDGQIWGILAAYGEAGEILPAKCEHRLADYTLVMATAISYAQARDELEGLAEQQGAALRRVASLVAQQAPPSVIFDAVAAEASRALKVSRIDVCRCYLDGTITILGSVGGPDPKAGQPFLLPGTRCVAERVAESGRASRVDDWVGGASSGPDAAGEASIRSVAGAPIVVDGTVWGVIVALGNDILREDTETKLTDFTHLVAGSISNVDARNNLMASRARIITASDETRRQIERNLHDGVQQRVLSIAFDLHSLAGAHALPTEAQTGLHQIRQDLESILDEIRVFSQGLHPVVLSRLGLDQALRGLTRRSPIPVNLTVAIDQRLPDPIETAVYYAVSEALANAAKHSQASEIDVDLCVQGGVVRAKVTDDGVGGASFSGSSGLIGLVDRVEALGGRFDLDSPVGGGTTISVELPRTEEYLFAPAGPLTT